MKSSRNALLFVLLPTFAACNPFGTDCDTGIVAAVEVEIRDAASLRPIADSARGIVRDGEYVDSLRPSRSTVDGLLSLAGADERPGVYEVLLTRPGYEPWDTAGIVVWDSDCHVRQAVLEAYMRREQ
jgi:hypothetical protein